jgi:hypothetical protein
MNIETQEGPLPACFISEIRHDFRPGGSTQVEAINGRAYDLPPNEDRSLSSLEEIIKAIAFGRTQYISGELTPEGFVFRFDPIIDNHVDDCKYILFPNGHVSYVDYTNDFLGWIEREGDDCGWFESDRSAGPEYSQHGFHLPRSLLTAESPKPE